MRGRQAKEIGGGGRGGGTAGAERGGDASAEWRCGGGLLGAGLALLYAPSSGEETRRNLQRKLWKLRAMTEEKLDALPQQLGGAKDTLDGRLEDEEEDLEGDGDEGGIYGRSAAGSPREELERRLAD